MFGRLTPKQQLERRSAAICPQLFHSPTFKGPDKRFPFQKPKAKLGRIGRRLWTHVVSVWQASDVSADPVGADFHAYRSLNLSCGLFLVAVKVDLEARQINDRFFLHAPSVLPCSDAPGCLVGLTGEVRRRVVDSHSHPEISDDRGANERKEIRNPLVNEKRDRKADLWVCHAVTVTVSTSFCGNGQTRATTESSNSVRIIASNPDAPIWTVDCGKSAPIWGVNPDRSVWVCRRPFRRRFCLQDFPLVCCYHAFDDGASLDLQSFLYPI